MAAPAPRPCPFCGSRETDQFPDASGRCRACGRAFRGATPIGGMIQGEMVEFKRGKAVREKVRFGALGLVGGILAFVGIPSTFLIGAAMNQSGTQDYVAGVFNSADGALVCGGVSLLIIAGLYAIWAGMLVWRGFPERAVHLIAAGAITALAAFAAGKLIGGIVGEVGGILALVGGLLAWRVARAKAAAQTGTVASGS